MSAKTPNSKVIFFLLKIILSAIVITFIMYLSLSGPQFPSPPEDSLQSREPADTEDPLRKAYFTNKTRDEVLKHYEGHFLITLFGLNIPQYRLNYPPEEAQTIIRDQTRSTFLEEIVHPFRESIYINGFEPKQEKDKIVIENRPWRQKIIIRYVPSNSLVRLFIGLLSVFLIYIVLKEWFDILKYFRLNNRN